MRKTLTALALILATSSAVAETEYPTNPILRPITLMDGTLAVTAGVVSGEESDENRKKTFVNLGYGITDNLTIGFGGIKYRFLAREDNKHGLELAVSYGHRGYNEYLGSNDDSVAHGLDLSGKYVFSDDLAMTFGFGAVEWSEDNREDKNEFRYMVGLQKGLTESWSTGIQYTYRDLKDFNQNEAHDVNTYLNYVYSKNMDIGLFASYSSFDAQENGYKLDNNFGRAIGIYANYRF